MDKSKPLKTVEKRKKSTLLILIEMPLAALGLAVFLWPVGPILELIVWECSDLFCILDNRRFLVSPSISTLVGIVLAFVSYCEMLWNGYATAPRRDPFGTTIPSLYSTPDIKSASS